MNNEAIDESRRRLLLGAINEKHLTIASIGEQCLALNLVSCRTCEDHCEVTAIQFSPKFGGAYVPTITSECTSCGDCIKHCPVSALSIAKNSR